MSLSFQGKHLSGGSSYQGSAWVHWSCPECSSSQVGPYVGPEGPDSILVGLCLYDLIPGATLFSSVQ